MADGLGVTLALRAEQPGLRAWVDPDRLAQVVVNLVGNALKFSPGKDHVEVRLSRQGEWARLEVEDHGPGIPDAFRARIFQRFAQADGTDTREKGGTGLGLSIAKGFVERMGGSLAYDSRPGLTVFRVDLPAAPLPPLKVPPEHPMEQG
jgi:signal transduction histidine kinase